MTVYNIRAVKNGYIVQLTEYGDDYIAATLKDAAILAGEYIPDTSTVTYADGNQLFEVIRLARFGEKIGAIKVLRSMYTSKLGLKEAKDIVDAFHDAYHEKS